MAISFNQETQKKEKKIAVPFWVFYLVIFILIVGFVFYSIISSLPSAEDIKAEGTTTKDLNALEQNIKIMENSMFQSLRQPKQETFSKPSPRNKGRSNPFSEK